MPKDAHGRLLPTAVGPELDGLRTIASGDGTVTRIADVELPDRVEPLATTVDGLELPEHIEYEGLLGRGAMGEVHRVRDRRLHRRMALKVLKWSAQHRDASVQRFLDEAQATAQLQHPGIVPVHDLGSLPDGRLFFTMREVEGRTLGEVIRSVHEASSPEGWHPDPAGTTLRRLIEYLRVACEALAYAHERGVVHRDIKPDNIMVGAHGEVFVMDWGIAKLLGRADHASEEEALELTGRTEATRAGTVFGTPAYMAPEQAAGRTEEVDARTDVYALGALLFAILYGERPYRGLTARSLIGRIAVGIPPEVPTESRPPVPAMLEQIRARAMAFAPEERFRDASAMVEAITGWLDGSARRQRALQLVERAQDNQPRVEALRTASAELRTRAGEELGGLPGWAAEAEKRAAWALLDEADQLDAEADVLDVQIDSLLQRALAHDIDSVEARVALAGRWRQRHQDAESRRDAPSARRAEAQLRTHLESLPATHRVRVAHEAYLEGLGSLTLRTEPAGVPVTLHRYVRRGLRLVAVPVRALGSTPLVAEPVAPGSYLLVLDAPSGRVRVPLAVDRLEDVRLVDPDGDERTLPLPGAGELAADDVLVPCGWSRIGGDPNAIGSGPARRVWHDTLVVKRFPVTNAEYVAFLDDLVATGREEEALRHVPRERAGTVGRQGAMIYGRDASGRFVLRPDADGDAWDPDQAVACVTWHGATAYARWRAEREGRPWRLLSSDEWEAIGRGADARVFPWGDQLDPTFCCMRDSHPGRPHIADVDSFPIDESPYGVRGLSGNVRDWCADEVADGRKVDRGGFWLGNAREARLADQHEHVPEHRAAEIGFRIARTLQLPVSLEGGSGG